MPKYGSWLDLPSVQVAEIMAQTGFDFIVVDLEHGPIGIETAQAQMMAMNGTDCRSIVRVPEGTEAWVKRVLDAGADGVMVPKVETTEQAAAIVSWAYYAPKGQRGDARRVVRASGWGKDAEGYKKRWNESGIISVQIESVAGLENIEEIATVSGVTQLFYVRRIIRRMLVFQLIVRKHWRQRPKLHLLPNRTVLPVAQFFSRAVRRKF